MPSPKKCPIWLNEVEHANLTELIKTTKRDLNREVGVLVAAELVRIKRAKPKAEPPIGE